MIRAFENDLININILVDVGAVGKKRETVTEKDCEGT